MKLSIVTASTDLRRAESCIRSWRDTTVTDPEIIVVLNTSEHHAVDMVRVFRLTMIDRPDFLGTVPAFALGVEHATGDVIACLHDDLAITEQGWDDKVLEHFRRHPSCGLAGFGGAIGLGAEDMYQKPYDPMSLARRGFRSNMVGAELHGIRSTLPERVACLDGFSQIGTKDFFAGFQQGMYDTPVTPEPVWQQLVKLKIRHHGYDGMLGCLAARLHWDTWYIPVRCHHYGGRTAVGDSNYAAWARTQHEEGDQGFWIESHQIWFDHFKDVLPLRV
jgi:Glycosyl transferase family 2